MEGGRQLFPETFKNTFCNRPKDSLQIHRKPQSTIHQVKGNKNFHTIIERDDAAHLGSG